MGKITSGEMIADFRHMLNDRWGYIPSASGEVWTQAKQDKATDPQVKKYGAQWIGHHVADCSGAFVWAYRQHGLRIYHGSNRIARKYVAQLLPISEARPGMAAFKARKPGDRGYALPDEYKKSGDLNDYYHIGLVDADPAYVLNSQSVQKGFVRSKTAQNWQFAGWLKDEEEGDEPMQALYQATVIAANGKPVNLRKAPARSAARVCAVPVGSTVDALRETDEQWAEVLWQEKTGYMMREYLQKTPPAAPDERLKTLRDLLRQAKAITDELMGG